MLLFIGISQNLTVTNRHSFLRFLRLDLLPLRSCYVHINPIFPVTCRLRPLFHSDSGRAMPRQRSSSFRDVWEIFPNGGLAALARYTKCPLPVSGLTVPADHLWRGHLRYITQRDPKCSLGTPAPGRSETDQCRARITVKLPSAIADESRYRNRSPAPALLQAQRRQDRSNMIGEIDVAQPTLVDSTYGNVCSD